MISEQLLLPHIEDPAAAGIQNGDLTFRYGGEGEFVEDVVGSFSAVRGTGRGGGTGAQEQDKQNRQQRTENR